MNQDEHKIVVRRMAGLIAAASVLIAVYVLRLIFLQLVNSDSFKSQATNTTDYNFTVTAARGDIVDSAGRRIAASTTSYNVVLSKLLMGDEDLDTMLQRIVELLEAHGEKWNDSLLIGEPDAAGHYSFTAQADSTSDQKALAAMKDSLGLQQYATADDVMEKLVEDYKLESYPLHWQRVLGGIHYEMQQQAFSNVNNFVMAENVSEVTVATIKENSTRSYDEGDIIPHVLGRVGKITAEKWKVTDENGQTTYPLREKGYNMNDMIGVSGLEAVYEDELRGKDGVETITRISDGVIVSTKLTTGGQGAGQEHRDDKQHLQQRQFCQGCRRCGGGHQHEGRQCAGRLQLPQLRPEPLRHPVQPVQLGPGPAPAQPRVAGPVHPRLHLQACGGGGGAGFRRHQPLFHRLLQRCLYLL